MEVLVHSVWLIRTKLFRALLLAHLARQTLSLQLPASTRPRVSATQDTQGHLEIRVRSVYLAHTNQNWALLFAPLAGQTLSLHLLASQTPRVSAAPGIRGRLDMCVPFALLTLIREVVLKRVHPVDRIRFHSLAVVYVFAKISILCKMGFAHSYVQRTMNFMILMHQFRFASNVHFLCVQVI